MAKHKFSRRRALVAGGSALALGLLPGFRSLLAAATEPATAPTTQPANKRFLVAADDLFLLQRQKIKAFSIAQKCGLDGIQVDMGGIPQGLALNDTLRDPQVVQQFLDESKNTGVRICSLAFFGMYAHIYANMPIALAITREWVGLMQKMNVKFGFLPLMTKDGTMKEAEHAEVRRKTVAILKEIAPEAEKAGVIMGVESNLDGDGYKKFLDEVGSPAVQAFYNPGVGLENKYDVYQDIRDLGKTRVCALHIEQGSVAPETFEHLLGDGLIDFHKLKSAMEDINWSGWMSIARSRKKGREKKVVENFTYNAKYLHDMFPQ